MGDTVTAGQEGGTRQARRAEIAAGLEAVQDRIAEAARAAGRTDVPTLVVVTKRFPVSDLQHLVALGAGDVGENKAQELAAKFDSAASGWTVPASLRVHYIGQLQSNKAGVVAELADAVHSVDRFKTAQALDRRRGAMGEAPENAVDLANASGAAGVVGASRRGEPLDVLLQISLDGDPSRGGVPVPELEALVDGVAGLAHLRLRGVMAVAPLGADPDAAFARLRELAHGIRADHPEATWISAGMSGDLEVAVRHGATHLRVGSAILGSRQPLG